jgi:L-alanine-DL-glutamate epimerase-like enolase superfamily enzyme
MRSQLPFITGIVTVPPHIPFKAGTKSDASAWGDSKLPAADSLLVKVTTDQGLVGWGEAFGFRAIASAKLAIDQLIAALCVGQDATPIESLILDVQKKLHVAPVKCGSRILGLANAHNHHTDNFSDRFPPAPIHKSDGQTGE